MGCGSGWTPTVPPVSPYRGPDYPPRPDTRLNPRLRLPSGPGSGVLGLPGRGVTRSPKVDDFMWRHDCGRVAVRTESGHKTSARVGRREGRSQRSRDFTRHRVRPDIPPITLSPVRHQWGSLRVVGLPSDSGSGPVRCDWPRHDRCILRVTQCLRIMLFFLCVIKSLLTQI